MLTRTNESWLTAAIPMDNPYCSCRLTRGSTVSQAETLKRLREIEKLEPAAAKREVEPALRCEGP